jgi:medium-chain acyl-[acyl-carrier-protein] hydrolase
LSEPPFVSLPPLVGAVAEAMPPLLDGPFAFFGHSMGAIIAFELARYLRRAYGREPHALFASGRRAPHVPDTDPDTYDLPHDEFIEELRRIDGTPTEVLEHAELMELMIPLLRADFQLVQTYEYIEGDPLQCPIFAYGGLQDGEETRELMSRWKEQTISRFKLHMLPGDHFFLRSSQTLLLEMLARDLYEVVAS